MDVNHDIAPKRGRYKLQYLVDEVGIQAKDFVFVGF
jgi:hypothetical protein